jgi:dihydroorotase-like cyclic amidohydrolase
VTTLIRAGAVVTASQLGQLDDAGIAIDDGVITRVAPWREIEQLRAGAQIIDARYLVVRSVVI